MNRALIDTYLEGGAKLKAAYAGLSAEVLKAVPVDGSWTLQQIAVHMMESDINGTDRMKRVAAMENPLLVGFDETAFANLPGYNDISTFDAIELFDLNRRLTSPILRQLPDAAYGRSGIHTEAGKLTLLGLLEKYIRHLDHHLVFIESKKKLFAIAR